MIKRASALVVLIAITALATSFVATPQAAGVAVGRVHQEYQPNDGKVFVLVIGNDARAGNPLHSRSDAIHIVGINTKTMRGGILNFPRDSWVPIPGYGTSKINEALNHGGPDLLARTLENMTGIRLDYWVMVGFEHFIKIIRSIGDVRMHLPTSIYDPTGSGARLRAGTQFLGPYESLAYLRTRHSFAGGDITRTTNHGTFLKALLEKLRAQTDRDPSELLRWMSVTQRYARYDLSAEEMLRLGVVATRLKPKDVGNVTVPVSVGMVGAASVVFISSNAGNIYDRFRRTAEL